MPHLELSYPRPDIAVLTLNRPEKLNVDAEEALRLGIVSRLSRDSSVVQDAMDIAETLCGYGKFGLESTKQVLWANLDAPSLETALHLENRSQILAGTGGVMGEASAAFRHHPQ